MDQKNVTQKKEKVVYLELLRIIAAFLVIVNHTNSGIFMSSNPENKVWWVSVAYFYCSKVAVPVFLMISGALLLGRVDGGKKQLKRIARIFLDLILFSLMYYVYWHYKAGEPGSLIEFLKRVYRINITNAYWYLYLYLGILVMLPFLQRMSVGMGKRAYQYLLAVCVVFMGGIPILAHYKEGFFYHGMFGEPLFSVYVGMFFLGYYLAQHVEVKNSYAVLSFMIFVGGIVAQVFLTYIEYQRTPEAYLFYDDRTLLTTTATAAGLFYFVRWFGEKVHWSVFWRAVAWLGGCTFGIYLLSDLFIDLYAMKYQEMAMQIPALIAVVLYEVIVFLSGTAATAVLKHIPGVRRLV